MGLTNSQLSWPKAVFVRVPLPPGSEAGWAILRLG